MKKRSGCTGNLSLILLAAVTLAGCSAPGTGGRASEPQSGKSEDAETIEFAVMEPMAGDTAGFGQQQEYGVCLAVQEINENGGINGRKLVHDVYDDWTNTNQVAICTEKMIAANKYHFVVTSISASRSRTACPIWANANPPVLSRINTGNTITELGYKNYLRVCTEDSTIAEQMCDYMVNECGVKRPAILHTSADTDITNFDFTENYLKDKYNIDIIDFAQAQAGTEKDYTVYTTNFKGKSADAVYLFTEYSLAGLFLKQKTSPGWDVQVSGGTGRANPLTFQMVDAGYTEGFITVSVFDAGSISERIRKFVRSYTELIGVDPDQEAAGPYDLIYMISKVLKSEGMNGLNGNALVEWLRSNASYSGVMVDAGGFDVNGDSPNAEPHMLIAKNGAYVGTDEKQKEIKRER